jgi:glycosyltransferase involved in cell wall biosynthesis
MDKKTNLPCLGWVAWQNENGGYGHISQQLSLGLRKAGIQFANAYTGQWDLLLAVCTPAAWLLPVNRDGTRPRRDDMVIHTMFEAEPLPPGWVENLNSMGMIWTPSRYCADLFQSEGVLTPVHVIGYGVDPVYEYKQREVEKDRPMKFGIWADNLTGRKNVMKTVWTFIDAGLPDAELEIKLNSFAGMSPETAFVDKHGRPYANISIHMGDWPRKRLVAWLQSLDCLIYLSGGEGFGLMPLEAAATGCPVIVHACTGMLEYAVPSEYLLVESKGREPSITYTLGYGYPATQAKPNYDQAVEQIRWAYENRILLYDMGYRASMSAHQWVWETTCDLGIAAITDYWRTLKG